MVVYELNSKLRSNGAEEPGSLVDDRGGGTEKTWEL